MTFYFARGSEPEVEKIVDEIEGTAEIEADKDEVELEEGVLSEDRFDFAAGALICYILWHINLLTCINQ